MNFEIDKTYKATKSIIDSVWTLKFIYLGNGKIKIINYGRDDNEGYEKEKELPQCILMEAEKGRIVQSVKIAPFEYFREGFDDADILSVINQQNVFSYKEAK